MRTAYNIHQDRVHSENAFSRVGGALDVCGGCVQHTISRAFEESGTDVSPIKVEESV